MDKRLEVVCEEMNEHLSNEVIEIIDDFLKDRPNYSIEKLRRDFLFLSLVLNKNISPEELEILRIHLFPKS